MTNNQIQVTDLVTYMQDTMQMNPMTIYCQFTGKPVGRIYQDEVEPFIAGHTEETLEECADDMFLRVIGSMRPSLHWNVMRADSVDAMAKSRPLETLAYLLNRLFQKPDHLKIPLMARLNDQHMRIQTWQWLQVQTPFALSHIYAMLVEVDAKMNLSQQSINMEPQQLFNALPLAIAQIESWYGDCIARWERSQKHEEDSRRWFKGNTMARPAYLSSWLEAKPESKTAKVKREKKTVNREFDNILSGIMAEAAATPAKESVVPAPIAAKPTGTTRLPSFLMKKG